MTPSTLVEAATGRRFILQRTLGEGTFGSVFLAEMVGASDFRRKVALKLLNLNFDPASDAGRRLRDEARLLGRLQHRNIVRVDDLVLLNGRWGLVMEYIGGADLESLFVHAMESGEPISTRAVAEIGASVASALVAAWEMPGDDGQPMHVIHRDIKPSNIRMAETGEVKVLDFGVARAEFTGREARTERVRYGSLGYMAPERLLGDPDTPAGDVYALAVVIWELLTIGTYGRSELGIEQQAVQVSAARQRLLLASGSEAIADLVARALAYEPTDRPTAAQMEAELREIAREVFGEDAVTLAQTRLPAIRAREEKQVEGVTVLEESPSGPRSSAERETNSATLAAPPGTSEDPAAGGPPPSRKLPIWVPIAGGVALLALVGIGMRMMGGGATTEAPAPGVTTAAPVPPPATTNAATADAGTAAPPMDPAPAPSATGAAAAPATAAPAPVGAPAPTHPDARPKPATKTTAPAATPPSPAPTPTGTATPPTPPPDAPASSALRLRSAKFVLSGADGPLAVTCGDVRASGSSNLIVRDFPAGACDVTAGSLHTSITVSAPGLVTCTADGGALACR